MKKKDLRGTWRQALLSFFGPVLMVLTVRWILVEPFVIPSGSMIPTLQIHDHIFVNKLSFGVHVPFGNQFIFKWRSPQRGEVVVFRFPENPEVFYVKRVAAVGGDEISIKSGDVFINGKALEQKPIAPEQAEEGFDYFQEISSKPYTIRYIRKEESDFETVKVPEKSFFVIGDNRDQSNDSRFWGFIPEENLVGTAQWIWLSCHETLASAQFLCDPSTIRWDRLLKKVE